MALNKLSPSVSESVMSTSETAVDRQISFPLSNVLHVNGERNGQPLPHDFTEDIQFMDIEETSGKGPVQFDINIKFTQISKCHFTPIFRRICEYCQCINKVHHPP